MKNRKNYDLEALGQAGGVVALIGFVIVFLIVFPALSFVTGWFTGWCLKLIIGTKITAGLALLGIDITPEQIPLLCGVLNVVGNFFTNSNVKISDFQSDN